MCVWDDRKGSKEELCPNGRHWEALTVWLSRSWAKWPGERTRKVSLASSRMVQVDGGCSVALVEK